MWQGIDKRRFPRANYPCKVVVLKDRCRERFDTHTENIGVGGICVILEKEIKRFTEVDLILYLKDALPPVETVGRVVWAIERNESEFDTGIEFINLKSKYRLRIAKIVQDCLKEEG